MKKNISILAISLTLVFQFCAPAKLVFNYDHKCGATAAQGTKVIKVFTEVSKSQEAIDKSAMLAVHAVLFKGIVCTDGTSQSTSKMSKFNYEDKKEWFDNFFKSGKFKDFVANTNSVINSEDRLKLPSGKVKVGVSVQVSYESLKKYMVSQSMADDMNKAMGW